MRMQYTVHKVHTVHKETILSAGSVETFTEFKLFLFLSGAGSVVDMATRPRVDRYWVLNPAQEKLCLFSQTSSPALVSTQPPIQGHRNSFQRIKWPGGGGGGII
jgi:hypothetical protein